MNSKDFLEALKGLEEFRGLSTELLVDALKAALTTAFRKENEKDSMVRSEIDMLTGKISVFHQKMVVEEVKDDALEISLEDARLLNDKLNVGDLYETYIDIDQMSRAAALQFKQTLIQKIREAIKTATINEFNSKKHDIIVGKVEKVEAKLTILSIGQSGRTTAILNAKNSIPNETFQVNEIIKVYVLDVDKKGIVTVSRSDPGFLKRLFELEIIEIYDGTVEIRAIAREPGKRAKVAVVSREANVDPIGACIGQKGMRIQKITNQISNEKIDVIEYHDNPALFIMEALKPAKALGISMDEANKAAVVVVSNEDYSIAIGKEGQNVRLTVKLTGWRVDVKTVDQAFQEHIHFVDAKTIRDEMEKVANIPSVVEVPVITPEVPAVPAVAVAPVIETAPVIEAKPVSKPTPIIDQVLPVNEPVVIEEPVIETPVAPIIPARYIKIAEANSLGEEGKKPERPKTFKKKVTKEEETKTDTPKPAYMPVYTEDEIKEIEATETQPDPAQTNFEEEIDYDDYDKYYDEEE